MKKRLLSFITVSALISNIFLSGSFTVKTTQFHAVGISDSTITALENNESYIPRHTFVGAPEQSSKLKGTQVLPEYYSSADLGYTSGVDNQLTTDICWAFTHNELLEINLAKKYGIKYDFSEQTMKFETSNITSPSLGYMRYPNGSGNELFSTAYLARIGSTLESEEPFTLSEERTVSSDSLTRIGTLKEVPFYGFGINENNEFNANAVNTMKSLILEYGAVGSALFYYSSPLYESEDRTNYYYDREYSNYYVTDHSPNHSVTVIGWDDNYSADNFVHKPQGDGAFIVKNSWGLYHGNSTTDCVYVSYYDRHITNEIFATDYETDSTLYDNIYQYDPLGWVQNLAASSSERTICVTRFVADSPDETVSAVSTYITEAGMAARVMINTSGDFKNEDSYQLVYERTFDSAGYYVMPITPVKLSSNEYYVAIEFFSNNEFTQFAIQSNVRRLVDNSVNLPGTCFIGTSFKSLDTIESVCDSINAQAQNTSDKIYNPMLCIKSFTKSGESDSLENISAFSDMENTRWYAKAVDYAVGAKLFSGVSSTTFEPQTQMTRAMFVKVLANLSNIDPNEYTEISFSDVEKGRWYTSAVDWAVKKGIVKGITENTFEPYESITRQQMCVMIIRYANSLGILFENASDGFIFEDDSEIQSYAREAVYTCRKYGIISGMTETTFDPKSGATRAQVAKLFMNFCQKYIF